MLTMNSVKILHAVRSAITAIAELLVERHNSISFDDMCRQLVPLRDHSVAEKVLPDIQARSMFLQLVYWRPRVL